MEGDKRRFSEEKGGPPHQGKKKWPMAPKITKKSIICGADGERH